MIALPGGARKFENADVRIYQDARIEFDSWLAANRPEAPVFAGGFIWNWDEDSALARSYIVEYAESRGVTLPDPAG